MTDQRLLDVYDRLEDVRSRLRALWLMGCGMEVKADVDAVQSIVTDTEARLNIAIAALVSFEVEESSQAT